MYFEEHTFMIKNSIQFTDCDHTSKQWDSNQTRYDRDTQLDETPTFATFLDLSIDRSTLSSMVAEAEEESIC